MSAPPLRPDMAQMRICDCGDVDCEGLPRKPMTMFDRIIWLVIAVLCAGSAIGWFMLVREILP
jgi:hypothetical protein